MQITDINPDTLRAARELCADTENTEYVRGIAELIIDTSPTWDMDGKRFLMKFLAEPLDSRACL